MGTHTRWETTRPWILVDLRDGRFEVVQFQRVRCDQEQFLAQLRSALSDALAAHHQQVVTDLRNADEAPDDDRAHAVAWARRLASDPLPEVTPQRTWFPQRADGRDPRGGVHVSIVGSEVRVLEVSAEDLMHPTRTSLAIVAALNQAMDRRDADVMTHARRRAVDMLTRAPDPVDWAEIADRADRLPNNWA